MSLGMVNIVSGIRFCFPVPNAGTKNQFRLGAGLDLSAELTAIERAKIFLVVLHAGSLLRLAAFPLLLVITRYVIVPVSVLAPIGGHVSPVDVLARARL